MRVFLIPLTVLLALSACGSEQSGEFTTEDGDAGEYTIDHASGETSATIETSEGTATMRSGANVPVDLPAGFTLYPGATVITNTVVNHADGKGHLLTFESTDSPEKIAAFYKKQVEAAGIKLQIEATVNDGVMLAGEGEGDLAFSLNVSSEQDGSTAQLMLGQGLTN